MTAYRRWLQRKRFDAITRAAWDPAHASGWWAVVHSLEHALMELG